MGLFKISPPWDSNEGYISKCVLWEEKDWVEDIYVTFPYKYFDIITNSKEAYFHAFLYIYVLIFFWIWWQPYQRYYQNKWFFWQNSVTRWWQEFLKNRNNMVQLIWNILSIFWHGQKLVWKIYRNSILMFGQFVQILFKTISLGHFYYPIMCDK